MAYSIRPKGGTIAEFQSLNRVYGERELLLEEQGDGSYKLKAGDGSRQYNNLPYVGEISPIFNVKDYGAIGDGIVDDYVAIMAAYAAIPTSGGTILFPSGSYAITTPLTFGNGNASTQSTKQNIKLVGANVLSGVGGQFVSGIDPTPAKIIWDGGSQATHVVKFQGPITCGIQGVNIDGQYDAIYGLHCEHVFRSVFENIYIHGVKIGVRHTSYPSATGVAIGASDNRWQGVHVVNFGWPGSESTDGTAGFDIGTDSITTGFDVARDTFTGCTVVTKDDDDSASYVIRGADLLTFQNCMAYSVDDGRAYALVCIAPTGPEGNENLYKHLPVELSFINCPLIGRFWFDPTWNVDGNGGWKIFMWPVASGDMTNPTTAGHGIPPSRYGVFGVDTRGYFLGQSQFRTFLDDVCYETPCVMYRKPAAQTVTNTTTEATIFNININALIMRSRTATLEYQGVNDFVWDRMVRINVYGSILNSTGVSADARLRLGYGGSSIFDSGLFSVTTSGSGARAFNFLGTLSAGNSNNVQSTFGSFKLFQPGTGNGTASTVDIERSMHTQTSEDMSSTVNIFCAFKWETANTNLQCVIRSASVEVA